MITNFAMCYGFCLDVPPQPHVVISGDFSEAAGSGVCDDGLRVCDY